VSCAVTDSAEFPEPEAAGAFDEPQAESARDAAIAVARTNAIFFFITFLLKIVKPFYIVLLDEIINSLTHRRVEVII
jgi:hypothetical protein